MGVGSWVGEVVEPVDAFVGKDEEVCWGEVDENWLGEVPLNGQLWCYREDKTAELTVIEDRWFPEEE